MLPCTTNEPKDKCNNYVIPESEQSKQATYVKSPLIYISWLEDEQAQTSKQSCYELPFGGKADKWHWSWLKSCMHS